MCIRTPQALASTASHIATGRLMKSVKKGFTLLELLVAMAIMATLLTLIAPRYMGGIDRAKESVLRDDLATLRRLIDQFHGDRGRYPESLEELVTARYLREIPIDPLTDRRDSWQLVPPLQDTTQAAPNSQGMVADIKSGASGVGGDGRSYADW
jgi:general secretion pathway protein G